MDRYIYTSPIIKRSTVLKLADYKKAINHRITITDIEKCMKNEYIKKSIFVSSPSLYESIMTHKGDTNKIINSFMKYYIRMCSRTTPYANFSYTTVLTDSMEDSEYKSYIRIDDSWLAALINKLIKSDDVLIHLQVKLNSTLKISEHRAEIFSQPIFEKEEIPNDSRSIKRTRVFKMIEKKCGSKYTSISELYRDISTYCDSSVTAYKIFDYLRKLIYQGFLITNLDITISGNDRLKYLIDILTSSEYTSIYTKKIKYINFLVNKVNALPFDQGVEFLQKAQEEMKVLATSNQYFDCILVKNHEYNQLNFEKYKNVPDLLEKLQELYLNTNYKFIYQKYLDRYLEKYGREREVILTDLVDSGQLGMPEEDNFGNASDSTTSRYSIRFKQLIDDAYISNSFIVDLDSIEINSPKHLKNHMKQVPNLSPSLELFFTDGFVGEKNVDDKYVYCSPNIASKMQCNTIGRFVDVFDNPTKRDLKDIESEVIDEYSKHNIELVEVFYRDDKANTLNLVSQEPLTKKISCIGLNAGKHNELLLSDVLVGLDNNEKLYFKDKKSEQYIKFVSFSNLNPSVMSSLYRFLIETSYDGFVLKPLNDFMAILSKHRIQPKLVYKNIVIKPLTIMLNASEFKTINVENVCDHLRRYIHTDFIYMQFFDNRLLLDMRSNECMLLLVEELQKKKEIKITEAEGFVENLVDSKTASLNSVGELVIPYKYNYEKYQEIQSMKIFHDSKKKRVLRIGDEWVTFNIYCENSSQPILLTDHIMPTVQKLLDDELIAKFFYIRYFDEHSHIRLRIMLNNDNKSYYYNAINLVTESLYKTDLVNSITLNEYEREIERYGGDEFIDLYEDYFMYNSILSIKILKQYADNLEELDITMVLLVVRILDSFNLHYGQLKDISIMQHYKFYSSDFRKIKQELQNKYIEIKTLKDCTINKLYDIQKESENRYSNRLNVEIEDSNRLLDIVGSCLHMFCNRVYGIDRNKEIQLYSYLHYFLESRKYLDEQIK
jgi:thiopeptide-type bacteriocin biosynthesis protein